MTLYKCNDCGLKVKNNGGSCQEIGMVEIEGVEKMNMDSEDRVYFESVLVYLDNAKFVLDKVSFDCEEKAKLEYLIEGVEERLKECGETK